MNAGNPFREIFRGKVMVVGIGNTLRGDDGLGPLLAERLGRKLGLTCLNAGNAVENHLGKVIREKPDTVLLVDAVHLDSRPGDWAILDPQVIARSGICTHDLSLRVLLDAFSKKTKGRVYLLGVQPQRLQLGQGVSARVRRSLRRLERRIVEAAGAQLARCES